MRTLKASFIGAVLATAILFTACTTTNTTTGEKVFDPEKTAMILAPLKPAIAIGVQEGVKAKPEIAAYLTITVNVLDSMLAEPGNIERSAIKAALLQIQWGDVDAETKARVIGLGSELVLSYYDILTAYVIRDAVNADQGLRMALETLRDGIALGLLPGGQ